MDTLQTLPLWLILLIANERNAGILNLKSFMLVVLFPHRVSSLTIHMAFILDKSSSGLLKSSPVCSGSQV